MTEWQPIATAPKGKYTLVLAYFPARGSWRARIKEINSASEFRPYGDDQPTHWMPLPEPPT